MGRKPYIWNEFDMEIMDFNECRVNAWNYFPKTKAERKEQDRKRKAKVQDLRQKIDIKAIDYQSQGTYKCPVCNNVKNRDQMVCKRSKKTEKVLKRVINLLAQDNILSVLRNIARKDVEFIAKNTVIICRSCHFKKLYKDDNLHFSSQNAE